MLGHTFNELHNLDYDKISILKVQFLSIIFNGDVLFKLPTLFPNGQALHKCKSWIENTMAMLGAK
jgi:hypothetical protein